MVRVLLMVFLSGSLFACASSPIASPISADVVVSNGALVSVVGDGAVLSDQTIVVSGDRIIWAGAAVDAPPLSGDPVLVDARGKYVMAGFSDMHVHLPDANQPHAIREFLRHQLQAGVTSIRSMRGHPSHASIREDLRAGALVGPDLYVGSTPVIADELTPETARGAVERAKRDGADFIKVLRLGSPQSFSRLMAAANTAGVPVAGHLAKQTPASSVVSAGYRSLEHLHGVVRQRDGSLQLDKNAARTLSAGPSLFHCPTLFWYAVRAGVYQTQGASVLLKQPFVVRLKGVKLLVEHGAKLVVGSDGQKGQGAGGHPIHEEMQLFATAGLTPVQILRAATLTAAELRGSPDEGAVAQGYVANMVVLAGNPLADITSVRDVMVTIHRGKVFKPNGPSASSP